MEKVYTVIKNTSCTDYNDELPYTIQTYWFNGKAISVNKTQWMAPTFKMLSRKEAERELVRLCTGGLI